jgi:nicotinate-nucleotide pyrophosphorylase (carboxylating)
VAERDKERAGIVERALREDAAFADITTGRLVGKGARGRALIRARAAGTLSGQECARSVFSILDASISYEAVKGDGATVDAGEIVAALEGSIAPILSGERTALNFLQHLSGIATSVRRFVELVEGTGTRILDTRKTTPGLRLLEKEAVMHGGGMNHRKDLAELLLVKENHIAAAGGLERVIELLGEGMADAVIEVTSHEELLQLAGKGPRRIMLDNFTPEGVRRAMEEVSTWDQRPEIEVSGGVTLETVGAYAALGIDYISIGSITASAPALDMSLIVEEVDRAGEV